MDNLSFEHLPNQVARLTTEISELKNYLLQKDINLQDSEDILDAEACAKLISIEVQTLYGYTHRKEIPFYKPGKKLIFIKSEIIDWIKTNRHKTKNEISNEAETYLIKKGGNK